MSTVAHSVGPICLPHFVAASAALTSTPAAPMQLPAAPPNRIAEYRVIVPWEVVSFVRQSGYHYLAACLGEQSLLYPLLPPVAVETRVARMACDTIISPDQRAVISKFFDDVLSCQEAFNNTALTDPNAPQAWIVTLVLTVGPRVQPQQPPHNFATPPPELAPVLELTQEQAEVQAMIDMLTYIEAGVYEVDNLHRSPLDQEFAELFAIQQDPPVYHFVEPRPLPTLVPFATVRETVDEARSFLPW